MSVLGATALPGILVILAGALPPPTGLQAQPFPPLESPESPAIGATRPPPSPLADPPTPSVSLHVRAPASAAAGQEIDYRILVENTSQAAAHHVRVRSAVPAAATFVRASPEPADRDPQIVWELGTLPPGTSKEILLTLKPTEDGDIDVTARVQFEHGESVRTHVGTGPASRPPVAPPAPMPPAPMPPADPPPAPAPAPPAVAALQVRTTGPTHALVGDVVPFQLTVINTGKADALNVELDESLPEGLELWAGTENGIVGKRRVWKIGRLAPGQTEVRDLQAFARLVGEQENVVQATADGGLRETASCKVLVQEPKLSVKIVGPEKGLLNRPAKYQITVTNGGQAPLTNVEVRAELPAGVLLAGPPSNNGRQSGSQVRWLLGEAPPGQAATLTVELTTAKEMEAAVRVTARADRGVTDQAEAKTRFEGAAGLRVDVDKSEDPAPVGHVVAYTIHVLNRGSAPARDLRLTVTIPEQMQAVPSGDANGPTLTGRTLTFPSLPALDAGKETTYTIRLRALRAGAVKVAAELASADLATPLHEEENTTLYGEAPPAPDSPAVAPPPPLPGPG